MRDIPIVFPIALAIIVAMLLFTSAYAVSANAVASNSAYSSQLSPSGIVIPHRPGQRRLRRLQLVRAGRARRLTAPLTSGAVGP